MALTIYQRPIWRPARRRGPVTKRSPSSITELFVHWPGVAAKKLIPQGGWTQMQERAIMRDLQRGHFANGWNDIGYNHVMFPSGSSRMPRIYTARGAQYVPASQMNHNAGTISIMVYMGLDDFLHESTKARLRSYVRWADKYASKKLKVRGHGEVFGTQCPGSLLRKWVAEERHR